MTLAFVITAVVAGIMLFLWISARESLTEAEGKILQLDKYIHELQVNSERIIAPSQTKLTMELIHDVVKDNGFVPHQYEEDWVTFKRQGEEYFVGFNRPYIQFYRGFKFDLESDVEVLRRSAMMAMLEPGIGRIDVSDHKTLNYRVFGIEKTVEHLSESFNEYMQMLDKLIESHLYFFNILMEEKRSMQPDSEPAETPDMPNTIHDIFS